MINRKIIIIIIVIIAAVIGGLYLYNKGNSARQDNTKKIIFNESDAEPTTSGEQPTQEPTPTPDLKAHPIKVLNGSGEAGKALEIKTFLEEKGFTIAEVGNADSYDFT